MVIPMIPCSVGEVLDKITILKLKMQNCINNKATIAEKEMLALQKALIEVEIPPIVYEKFDLYEELQKINERLWNLENSLRSGLKSMERTQTLMGKMALVPELNDQRAELKSKLNEHFNSEYTEVKSYVV